MIKYLNKNIKINKIKGFKFKNKPCFFKILTLSFIFLLFLAMLIFINACKVLDNYFVKKQDYDALFKNYNYIIKENDEIKFNFESALADNENLSNELKEKNFEIEQMSIKLEDMEKTIAELEKKLSDESIKNLEEKIKELKSESDKLRKLLNNMNDILKFVYIGSSAKDDYGYQFTAFSIEYKGKYYIITAGHCVSDNYGKEGTFKFKANFSQNWLYPDLLCYNSEFLKLNDYAVFEGNVYGGLKIGSEQSESNFVMGSIDKNLNVFRNLSDSSKRGESGSPVINEEMQVIGIYVIYGYVYTPIQLALDAIDSVVID